jgi:hypothetical protein
MKWRRVVYRQWLLWHHSLVPLQAVPAPTAFPAPTPMALIQEGGQAGGEVQDRVMQQFRWIEKLVFVAIFLALYAIMKK